MATRQSTHAGGVSGADRLLAHSARILAEWERRLRAQVAAASREAHPILINTLPALIRQLGEAMNDKHPRRTATEGSTIAEEHGGERVRMTNFRLQDVIAEYRLLREVIIELVEEEEPLTREERNILNASIDQSITKACTAYVLVQERFREQFFVTLAHDLRGPLAAAKANAGLILRKPQSEQVPRWAARAVDGLDRVDRMVQDLLDAMRAQAGKPARLEFEPCDLVEVARQAIEHLEAEHGERFVLAADKPVNGRFACDPMRRAIENLAGNAVKYGSPERAITITVAEKHERAFVVVHNHGRAIPPEEQENIFHAFQRAPGAEKNGRRGWGLGLAQVRGVAEAHGGSIGVDSLPEKGTSFTIDVPVDPPSVLQA